MRKTALIILAVVLAAACGEDYPPYNRLTKTRILAIAADPPMPGPGEATTFTPLFYDPEDEQPLSYEWTWCPAAIPSGDGFRCLLTADQLAAAGVPERFGTGMTATFGPIDPALLKAFCDGVPGQQKPNCDDGVPLQVQLTATTKDPKPLLAVYTLRLRIDAQTAPNQLPHIDGLSAVLDGAPRPITDDLAVTVPRNVETHVQAAVPEDVAERYQGKDEAGNPKALREQLTLSWFVESGDVNDGRTGFAEGVTSFEAALDTKWEPAREKDYPATTSRLIVVIRDNRGGVAWRAGAVRLETTP